MNGGTFVLVFALFVLARVAMSVVSHWTRPARNVTVSDMQGRET